MGQRACELGVYAIFALLISGCGTPATSSHIPVAQEEHRIGGMLAKDYYRQFLYRKIDDDQLPFKYLSNSFTKLKKIDAKNNLYFNASLYLLGEGKYVFDYQEVVGETGSDGMMTTKPVFKKRIHGNWQVSEVALLVDGVGQGAGFTYNEKETLNLKFDRAFHAPELKEKSDWFHYTSSNQGMPEDQ